MVDRLGQYELLEKFAEGGMAEVWFGRVVGAEGFTREVAVKRMLTASARDSEAVSMFLDEARLGARLHHPNICSVLDLGELDGEWFMVLELVDGPHLGRLFAHSLRIGKPLPLPLCVAIVASAAEGLHHAHERVDPLTGQSLGIIHRDVSPQNILVSRFGYVKVTDFGVARARTHRSRTRSGLVKGKLGYLSPEQCRGQPLDRRADVFSLGIVLYELLTRRRLYRGDGEFDVMRRICEEEPLPPSVLSPDVDGNLGDIALRALRKEPEARYQSAGELGDALTAWLQAHHPGDLRGELGYWLRTHTGAIWPPLEQRQLRWRERSGDGVLSVDEVREQVAMPALRTALPRLPGVFVGRRSELRVLREDEARLRVLVGMAGVGKSRLALRFAELEADAGERVVWVDLGGVDRVEGAVTAVARALAIDGAAARSEVEGRVGRALAAGPALLVLDNVDGVSDGIGRVLGQWLGRAAQLRCLVTTRQRLRWQGEALLDVAPLSLPEGDSIAGSEAAMLFLARARAVRGDFRLAAGQEAVVARMVRLLDGVPLAIELAAARLDVLEPDGLLERLERGAGELRGPTGQGVTTLREVFASAIADLPEDLARTLARATVFAGPFELVAAEAVLADDATAPGGPQRLDRAGVLERLDALLDRSLLRRHPGEGLARYELLASLRPAARAVVEQTELRAAYLRHDRWLAESADALRARLDRHGGAVALQRMDRLRPELEAAVVPRASDLPAVEPATVVSAGLALAELLGRLGPSEGVAEVLERVEGAANRDGVRAQAWLLRARGLLASGRIGEARRAAERAGAAAPGLLAPALVLLAEAALRQERHDEARAFLARAARAVGESADAAGFGGALLLVEAACARAAGDAAGSDNAAERAADALRAVGDGHRESAALLLRAEIALDGDTPTDLDRAADACREALEIAERGRDIGPAAEARALLALVALSRGELEEAALSLGAAEAASLRVGAPALRARIGWLAAALALLRGEPAVASTTRALELAHDAGGRSGVLRALCWQAVAFALEGRDEGALSALDHAEGWAVGARSPELAVAAARVHGEPAPALAAGAGPSARLLLRLFQGA
ncbi:MAG: hypothetical protein RIT45_3052 [Pseudomonadota bacterium]|jgi:predicted ATPase